MTTISTRNSVLGVMPEVTQNTLLAPTGVGYYVPLQDDFSMESNYDQIENLEIRASIGRAASVQGSENPSGSLSFYLKGSGTEGAAPHWSDIAKSFFGTETVEGTQRTTTTSSTVSVIKSTSAATYMGLGYGLLIKDPTNGYSVRVVHSVSTNDITPSFDLANAPATGIGLGKPVYWSPANSAHTSLSLFWYGGNGGVTTAVSGCLINSIGFTASVNDSINANAGYEGLTYYVNPIEITAGTSYIDWTDDGGTFAAAVSAVWYKDPYELAEAVETAMNAASGETFTVAYSDTTGKFSILCTGTVLSLLWDTGTNTASTIGTKLGFSVAADDTGTAATTGYTADSAQSFASPYTPSFDSTQLNVGKNQEVMMGLQSDYACFNASEVSVNGTDTIRKIGDLCAESGYSSAIVNGREFEVTIKALLNQYDVKQFARFRLGTEIRFQATIGQKSGGNWVAGEVVYAYAPTAKITGLNIVDDDGLVSVEITLQPFVPASGNGEFFVGQL